MMKRLTPEQLVEFKRLRSMADNTVCRLGMRRAEYLDSEKRLLQEIIKHEDDSREFGERILKELGLDFVKENYTFTPDGEIKCLVAGKYEDID